jgi:hypothetical protein
VAGIQEHVRKGESFNLPIGNKNVPVCLQPADIFSKKYGILRICSIPSGAMLGSQFHGFRQQLIVPGV